MSFSKLRNSSPQPPQPSGVGKTYMTWSKKGGSGKTTMAGHVVLAHRLAGLKIQLTEYDPVCPLAILYPGEVDSHNVAPDFEAMMSDSAQSIDFFGPLLRKLRCTTAHQVIDLGSPVAEPLMNVMRFVDFGRSIENGGAHIRPIIPTTIDKADLKAAEEAYDGLRGVLPNCRIAIVISERNGGKELVANTPTYKRIVSDPLTKIVVIKKGPPTALFNVLYGNHRLPPDAIVTATVAEVAKLVGPQFDSETLPGWMMRVNSWLLQNCEAFGDFLPSRKAAAA